MNGEDVMEVEVFKERREHWKGGSEKSEKRNRRKSIGRRQWAVPLLYKLSLLGGTCIETFTHLLMNTNTILPYN